MVAILITSPDEKRGKALSGRIAELIKKEVPQLGNLTLIGPAKASIGKINDIYRFVFYCKSTEYGLLTEIKDKVEAYVDGLALKEENIQFDFDPMNSF